VVYNDLEILDGVHTSNQFSSMIKIYGATYLVLEKNTSNGSIYSQRGDAVFVVKLLMSFDFAFILHVMKKVMRITTMLCQAL